MAEQPTHCLSSPLGKQDSQYISLAAKADVLNMIYLIVYCSTSALSVLVWCDLTTDGNTNIDVKSPLTLNIASKNIFFFYILIFFSLPHACLIKASAAYFISQVLQPLRSQRLFAAHKQRAFSVYHIPEQICINSEECLLSHHWPN